MADPARVQRGRPGGRPRLGPGLHPPGHRRRGRHSDDLAVGSYRSLSSPAGTWTYARGERTVVALNMSGRAQPVEATGTVVLSTERTLEGTAVDGTLTLAPWTGVVITS